MSQLKDKLNSIIEQYNLMLNEKINLRKIEMQEDNLDHYLIYNILGIDNDEGFNIDLYQNIGRFLYKYSGSLLEELTSEIFKHKFPNAKTKVKIENTITSKPKTVEIDVLNETTAYEIKWRDATTDGDHINKEHTRLKVISDKGFKPVRIMYFMPNRESSIKIQNRIKDIYIQEGGEAYFEQDAWNFVENNLDFDFLSFLKEVSNE